MNWNPIETAPTDGTQILCFIPDDDPQIAVCEYFTSDAWSGFIYSEHLVNDVTGGANPTHWVYKPTSPEEK